MTNRWAVALEKNVELYQNTRKYFHDCGVAVKSYKAFRKFPSRAKARTFISGRTGNPCLIVDTRDNILAW